MCSNARAGDDPALAHLLNDARADLLVGARRTSWSPCASTNSMAASRPLPERISPTLGWLSKAAWSALWSRVPRVAERSTSFSRSMISTFLQAHGAAGGMPRVGVGMHPLVLGLTESMASFTSLDNHDAAQRQIARRHALGKGHDVGQEFQCVMANRGPVRQKPVITSSAMKSTWCLSQTFAHERKVVVGGIEHTAPAVNRLGDECGHRIRPLAKNRLLEQAAAVCPAVSPGLAPPAGRDSRWECGRSWARAARTSSSRATSRWRSWPGGSRRGMRAGRAMILTLSGLPLAFQ